MTNNKANPKATANFTLALTLALACIKKDK